MSAPDPSPRRPALIGPGRLVLVTGPSGAGKDTLIAGARAACAGDPAIVFPRRVVTRPASGHEDHDSLDETAFEDAVRDGAFAFWWHAHGLKYGVPRVAEDDVGAGRTVVCNASRGVVADLRLRFARVEAVLVTAPADMLAARLAGRARATDGSLARRLGRNEAYAEFRADHVIENSGAADAAVQRLIDVIRGAVAAADT